MANHARDHSVAETLDYVGVRDASMLQHDEIREAWQANAEKRPGEFADLPPGAAAVRGSARVEGGHHAIPAK